MTYTPEYCPCCGDNADDCRLHAAAPDLLAALEKLSVWLIRPDMDVAHEMREQARAAIKQAKGEPQR